MKYTILIIILLLPNIILAQENKTIALTVNLTSQASINNDCNISISITIAKEIYESGEQIEFYNNLTEKKYQYQIKYYIIDDDNNTIKQPVITQNLNTKHFTPKEKKDNYYITIKNELISISCNNTANKITSEKRILIKGNPEIEEETQTNNTKTAKTTQTKTTTPKTAEKSSKETNKTQQKDYTITPLAVSESLLNQKDGENTTAEDIFVSGEEKAKSYVPYLFMASLILLAIYLIKQNGIQNKSNNRNNGFSRKSRK